MTRIAVIARRDWQHWLVGAVNVFLHPQVKSFDPGHESDALRWIGKANPSVVTTGAGDSIERPRRGHRRRALTDSVPEGGGAQANMFR